MNEQEKQLARALLQADFDALSPRDQRVLTRIAKRARISRDVHAEFEEGLRFGARLADKVARFGEEQIRLLTILVTRKEGG